MSNGGSYESETKQVQQGRQSKSRVGGFKGAENDSGNRQSIQGASESDIKMEEKSTGSAAGNIHKQIDKCPAA